MRGVSNKHCLLTFFISIDFDLCSSIVKSIYDCRLPSVIMGPSRCYGLIVVMATATKQNFKYSQKCLLFLWHQALEVFLVVILKHIKFYFRCFSHNNCSNALGSFFSDPGSYV